MRVVGKVAPEVVARLASAAKLVTLAELAGWGGDVIDVITQNELTHDVIARRDGAFVVFDAT